MKTAPLIGLALLLTSVSVTAASANVMYRYTNAEGTRVFSYTLPPDQARNGYEKVDLATGQVEAVAPELPPEVLASQLQRDQAIADCRLELQRVYALYSSERDIGHAQAVALDSLEKRVGQIHDNIRLAERELEHLQKQAANLERAGRAVTADLVATIERRQSQIEVLYQEVAQRRNEVSQAEHRYGRELERFRDGTCPEPDVDVATRR
jgi:flagellar biosynthesis chaperone FliJ